MLDADLMVGADDRPLKQAPDVLNGIGVDIAIDPLFGAVVDSLVACIVVGNSLVGGPIVGIDCFGVRCGIGVDEVVNGRGSWA